LLLLTASVSGAQQPSRFTGLWQGTLQAGAVRLRLGLTIQDSAGATMAVLTSIDQGNAQIPASIVIAGDSLHLSMPAIGGSYAAVLSGDSLRGTFTQGAPLPLVMGRTAGLSTVSRPQTPKAPFPYAAQDVSVSSAPGVTLACTRLVPQGTGPFPAVVFVTGSGPQDRNEALLGHEPFLVISDYLARHGIASLRCDDRGVAKSTGNFRGATSADFAVDADSALEFLRRQPGIAPTRVGILGHSEGGLIAPIVASHDPHVAFLVLMAGPGLRGDSILILQQRLISAANGEPQAQIDEMTWANRKLFRAVIASSDSADAARRVDATRREILDSVPAEGKALAARQLDEAVAQLLAPWMRYFLKYDPVPALRSVKVPVLALNGALDLQVPPKPDLAAIDTALRAAGNKDYRVVELPGLNHLFQTARTGAVGEYSQIEETTAPVALETIAQWINAHFGRR
jgi:fermentation-respiration switch protein FrsA (DUF1100 family)